MPTNFEVNDIPFLKPNEAARATRVHAAEGFDFAFVEPITHVRRLFIDDRNRDAKLFKLILCSLKNTDSGLRVARPRNI